MSNKCLECEKKDELIVDLENMSRMNVIASSETRMRDLEGANRMLREERNRLQTKVSYLEGTIVLSDFFIRLRYLFTRKLGSLNKNAEGRVIGHYDYKI